MNSKIIIICLLGLACAFTHRRAIKSCVNGEEMPKAPKWHYWLKKDKRRS